MTREEVIKYLEQHGFIDDEVKDMCIEALANDINVGSKWIPIGQYPSEPSLLCFEDGSMVVGYYNYDDDGWVVCTSDIFETDLIEDDIENEIVAWQPLPEPYKGE